MDIIDYYAFVFMVVLFGEVGFFCIGKLTKIFQWKRKD